MTDDQAKDSDILDHGVLQRMAERADASFVQQLVRLVIAEMDQRLARIAAAESDKDYSALSRASHSIAGSAATLGARRLSALARLVEDSSERAEPTSWTLVPQLLATAAATRTAFVAFLSENVKDASP